MARRWASSRPTRVDVSGRAAISAVVVDLAAATSMPRHAVKHLACFELLFALFAFSSSLKAAIPLVRGLPLDITLLFFALSLPVGLYVMARQGVYRAGLPIVLAWLVFVAWVGFSLTWTPVHGVYLFSKVRDVMIVNSWTVIGGALIIANRRIRVYRFIFFTLVLAVITTAIVLLKFGSFAAYVPLAKTSHHFARLAAFGAIIAYVWFTYARVGSATWVVTAALLLMFLTSLTMIGARSLMIYTFLLLLLPAVLGLPRAPAGHLVVYRSQVQVLLVVACVFVAVSTIMLTADELPWTLRRLTKLFEIDGENLGLLENRRFFFYWVALRAWDKAVLFGHGIASFPLILGTDPSKRSYPHNVLLETFSELGLVGGLLLLLVLALCLWPLRPARLRAEPLLLACVMIALLGLLHSMVSGDLPSLDYALLFFGLARLRPAAAEAVLPTRRRGLVGFAPKPGAAVHDMGDGPSSWSEGSDSSSIR